MGISKMDEALEQLLGEQLSSVEFVQDYFQLRFDGPTINVTSDITRVKANGNESTSWDQRFRNMLCGQIAKKVKAVALDAKELKISFEDGSEIAVSLAPEDVNGPEALYFHGFKSGERGVV